MQYVEQGMGIANNMLAIHTFTCGARDSNGYSASSTTKTGRHDIDEILLKVALNRINQIKSKI
jgi:hypothetical protein